MKTFFKRFALFIAIVLGLILLISVVISAFFKKQLGEQVLNAVNSTLITELRTETIDIDLLSSFPNASLVMNKVHVPDAIDGTSLLEAEELAFKFNLTSLFGSAIKIKSVTIKDGALFVSIDKRGKGNFDIVKADDSPTESSSDIAIVLEDARLEKIELIFINEKDKQELRWDIEEAMVKGNFSSTRFALTSFAEIKSVFLEMADERYLVGKDLAYDAVVDVDLEKGTYQFDNVDLFIENNNFKVEGNLTEVGEDIDIDLSLKGKDCSLSSIIDLLPEEQMQSFADFKSKGDFKFTTLVKGIYNNRQNPLIEMEFGLENGSIKSERLTEDIKDVSFTATFDNGKKGKWKNAVFNIEDFIGFFGRERVESTLKITDLERPKVQMSLDGVVPMEAVYKFMDNPNITDGSGEVEIQAFNIDGYLEDMISPSRISRVDISGTVVFDDAAVDINGETMAFDKGELVFDDNILAVNQLELEGADNEITFNGKFKNLFPVLLADSLNSKNAKLLFQAELKAKTVDLDKLLALSPLPEEGEVEAEVFDSLKVEQTQEREKLTNFLKGTFESEINEFKYRRLEAEDFEGKLAFDDGKMFISGDVNAMDGNFELDGIAYFEEQPKMKAKLICNDIDGEQFFYQTENFGQTILTDEHIRGRLNAKISIDAIWDEEGTFLEQELEVLADVTILDGELLDFKMLEDLSAVVKSKDLKQIRFSKLRNWLQIADGKLFLPVMFIQNNALNLEIAGSHSFEHDMEYGLKVNAGQTAWNKLKSHNKDLDPIKSKKNGWFSLYYRIFGNLDDFEYKSDKKGVKRLFEESEKRKRSIQESLVKKFGFINLMEDPTDGEEVEQLDNEEEIK